MQIEKNDSEDQTLADVIHLAKKICNQKKIEYDPYKIFLSIDEKRNIVIWIDSEGVER